MEHAFLIILQALRDTFNGAELRRDMNPWLQRPRATLLTDHSWSNNAFIEEISDKLFVLNLHWSREASSLPTWERPHQKFRPHSDDKLISVSTVFWSIILQPLPLCCRCYCWLSGWQGTLMTKRVWVRFLLFAIFFINTFDLADVSARRKQFNEHKMALGVLPRAMKGYITNCPGAKNFLHLWCDSHCPYTGSK